MHQIGRLRWFILTLMKYEAFIHKAYMLSKIYELMTLTWTDLMQTAMGTLMKLLPTAATAPEPKATEPR